MSHHTHCRSYREQVFMGQMSKHWKSWGLDFDPIRSTPLCSQWYNTYAVWNKNTRTNTKSMHSEMGPVWQNPIQRTVRTAHLSVLMNLARTWNTCKTCQQAERVMPVLCINVFLIWTIHSTLVYKTRSSATAESTQLRSLCRSRSFKFIIFNTNQKSVCDFIAVNNQNNLHHISYWFLLTAQ